MVSKRVIGLDLARGIAVWGMILMNFKIVMTDSQEGFLGAAAHFMEGHFGVLFVVLAGIGISLFMKSTMESGDREAINRKKFILVKRSIFLIVVGMLFSLIWRADILHYYGFYIGFGLLFIHFSSKWLWGIIAIVTLTFPVLFLVFPYDSGWNWENLTYVDFYTLGGFIKNTFFNGFHPLFPWAAFLLFGIILGRIELQGRSLRTLFILSIVVTLLTEVLAHYLVATTSEPLSYFFSRDAMPPGPLFVIAAGAEALFMISVSIYLTEYIKKTFLLKPLVATGQMVLSHYIIHIFLGFGILELLGGLDGYSLVFSIIYSTVYFAFAVLFSFLWGRVFTRGPMETLMRRISG